MPPAGHLREQRDTVDPDPFTIGIGLITAFFAATTYLETRRTRHLGDAERHGAYRQAWSRSRRTLTRLERQINRFEARVTEHGFADEPVRFGVVRLLLPWDSKEEMRKLQAEVLMTASHIGNHIDDLSEHLGPEHEDLVREIHGRLADVDFPETYGEVAELARDLAGLFEELLGRIAKEQEFDAAGQ